MNKKMLAGGVVLLIIIAILIGYLVGLNQTSLREESQPNREQKAPIQKSSNSEAIKNNTVAPNNISSSTTTAQTTTITLYHYTVGNTAEYVSSQRTIAFVPKIADATLKELFAAYLPKIQNEYIDVTLQNGIATVNFKSGANAYLNAAPGISAEYINSIRKTLLQFNTITDVRFAIEGKTITDWDA